MRNERVSSNTSRRRRFSALTIALAFFCGSSCLAAVHPGDKLDVVVFDHPDISTTVTVSNDGSIFIPLAGQVRAQGLEPQVIARDIEDRLDPFIFSPAVDVRVVSQSEVAYLAGSTNATLTLHALETLAMAMGTATLPTSADLSSVTILRDGRKLGPYDLVAMQSTIDTSPQLVAGDIINVPAQPIMVRVTGAVKTPATVFLARDTPLESALESVQPADNANVAFVQVVRNGKTTMVARGAGALANPGVSGDQLIVPPFANVTVLGYVSKSGPVTLKGDQSLATAITTAGGPAKGADLGRIVVISGDGTGSEHMVNYNAFTRGDASGNPQLQNGDMVYIPKQRQLISPQALLVLALLIAKKAGLKLSL